MAKSEEELRSEIEDELGPISDDDWGDILAEKKLRSEIEDELGPISDDDWGDILVDEELDILYNLYNGLTVSDKQAIMEVLKKLGYKGNGKSESESAPVPSWAWGVVARAEAEISEDYTLCGVLVIPSPISITETKGDRGAITIRVTSPDVSPDEVASAYQKARKRVWNIGRSTYVSKRDRALIRFVHRTDNLTWAERLEKWNHDNPEWRFDYPDALRIAYSNAFKKIWPSAWD